MEDETITRGHTASQIWNLVDIGESFFVDIGWL
jgi:hypothetical protein